MPTIPLKPSKPNYYSNKFPVGLKDTVTTTNDYQYASWGGWGELTFGILRLQSGDHSYGVLGYDAATDFYLYETRYSNNGSINLGERNTSSASRIGFDNFGNPNLKWEKSEEFNIGVEGLAFNKTLPYYN